MQHAAEPGVLGYMDFELYFLNTYKPHPLVFLFLSTVAPIFLENEEQEIQCKEKQGGGLTAKSLGKAGQTSQKKPGRAFTLVPLLPVRKLSMVLDV